MHDVGMGMCVCTGYLCGGLPLLLKDLDGIFQGLAERHEPGLIESLGVWAGGRVGG